MASSSWSTSTLLASLILLYWTTSSAGSHDLTCSNNLPPYRVKRALPYQNRQMLAEIRDCLTAAKSMIGKLGTKKSADVMKSLYNFANLASGIGALASSIINMAMIPGKNPLREGFAELDRNLDSFSIQISNLATDVEWFNYDSVYSQDKVCILNAWKKFCQFPKQPQNALREDDVKYLMTHMNAVTAETVTALTGGLL